MDNWCMLVQTETQLTSEKGQCTINWMNIFPRKEAHQWWGFISFRFVQLDQRLVNMWRGNSHRWQHWTPRKLHKEIGGLEGRGEGLWESFDYLWVAEGLYWELDSFWAKALRNPDYISTCMIIQRWGFRQVLSLGKFFCVMCDWFLLISYMFSYWCCSWLIKLLLNCL